jgi:transposase
LYSALGVSSYDILDSWREDGRFHLRLGVPVSKLRCPQCGDRNVIRRGLVDRMVHAPPVGLDRAVYFIQVPRLECRRCERVLTASLPNVVPQCNYTKSLARLVVDLRKMMTIRDVARYVGVGEGMIRGIDKKYLEKHFSKPRLKDLEVIAIDELNVGRNRFLTIVIDWTSGAIVFVGQGKGGDALLPFWRRLKASHAKIQAVATDMSSAYYAAVMKHLPDAKHVFDRFHIVKLMNEKLTVLRRELQREAEQMNRPVLKGIRWLLLKHPEHLDDSRNERERLAEALKLNESLATAYYLKEDLSQLWNQSSKVVAGHFLKDWCRRARASGIRILQTMANTLEGYRTGILNWYDFSISNGPLEGINNKIGALQRMAYGYRNQDYFIAKLYALHLAKFALIG